MAAAKIEVPVEGADYTVTIGAGVRDEVATSVEQADRVAVLADQRVVDLHGLPRGLGDAPTMALEGGENIKSLSVLEDVLDFCAAASLARSSALVAVGGGTIGDLGGLSASLFKRGLGVVQVPTTLLAQVDASVGGKTAVNLRAGKNLAGTFHQPRAVFCDTEFLATLDDEEFKSGLGEVVKTALIGGEESLQALESRAPAVTRRDPSALAAVVTDCVATKARIVVSDPTERGERRVLNLGHTFGHAIEHAAGYGRVPHGVAVAVGLDLAARASEGADLVDRIGSLLSAFGLPASLEELRHAYDLGERLTADALIEGLGHDKKGRVGAPEFVLMRGPGRIEPGQTIAPERLHDLFR